MHRIDTFLELLVKQDGSDLHLVSGNPPRIRLHGDLIGVKYRDLSAAETIALVSEIMPEPARAAFEEQSSVDFAYAIEGVARFRVNVYRHVNGVGAVLRLIPVAVRTLEQLALPSVLAGFCRQRRGLVLCTGPTGSGKSTTLAACIDHINSMRKGHIVTIEDPIEFVHRNKSSLVSQREVGFDTHSFATALHSALREDPDVILVGEMRDLETISLAVTAAETGILVLGTLHTNGAAATVDRIVNVFPPADQGRIRSMLSTSLLGVVSQQLVRRADGKGRVAALEVLVNNPGVSNILRDGKAEQLATAIQSGGLQGMQSMDTALRRLMDAKVITGREAYRKAINKREFEMFAEPELAA
ncbi:MAG: type IV pilus twitching motility protein PilT [Betaproteobacteria bacterium]|nr:MAG: type IV pilus twitching motility protein PilT [Betaproteobacteria bacterium]